MSTLETTQPFPLELIFPSETNPRKHFDDDKLEELAASIKLHGVLQPLLIERRAVAKNLKRGSKSLPTYEIVAGERRYRAALLAGLKEVPCIVKTLTVQQALEIKLIENLQREDLDPVEEAQGFAELLKAEVPAATIAERVGKAKAYVYGALKLLNVPAGEALEALRSGKLSRNHGILIGRIPSEKLRAKAVQEILHPTGWQYEHHAGLAGQVLSFRESKEWIEENCMVELKGAPFDRKSLLLVDGVPSCEHCPKRTGNDAETFPEARADVCTDPECFRKKAAAALAQKRNELTGKGVKVLPAGEAKKALRKADFFSDSEYVTLGKRISHDPQSKTIKEALGEAIKADTVAAIDEKGNTHYLVPRNRVEELLEEKGLGNGSIGGGHNFSRRDVDWIKQNRINHRFRVRFYEQVTVELANMAGAVLGLGKGRLEDLLLALAWEDRRREDVAEALGWCKEGEEATEDSRKQNCTTARQAFLALLVYRIADHCGYLMSPTDQRCKEMATRFGVDLQAVYKSAKKEIEAEEQAAAAEAPATPANGKNGKHKKAAAAKS